MEKNLTEPCSSLSQSGIIHRNLRPCQVHSGAGKSSPLWISGLQRTRVYFLPRHSNQEWSLAALLVQFFSLFLLQLQFNSDGNAGQEGKAHQVTEERGPSASIALWDF